MTRNKDIIGLLRAARPDDLDDVDQATRDRVFRKACLTAGSSPAPCGTAGVRRAGLAALGAGAVAVAVAAGWVLIAGPVAGWHQSRLSARAGGESAAVILLTAAADVQQARTAPTGRYWHTSVRTGGIGGLSARLPGTRTARTAASGCRCSTPSLIWRARSGLWSARPPGTPRPAAHSLVVQWMQLDRWVASTPSDATWFAFTTSAAGHPVPRKADRADSGQWSFDVEGRALTMTQLARLPTSPAALRAFLLAPYPADYQHSRPAQLEQRLFGEAADLTLAPVDPAVRAAVYRLLAGLPGIEVLGPAGDAVGRHGTAIAVPDGDVLHELIIDPRTGAVLDTQDVTRAHGHTAIVFYNAILTSGWSSALPLTPQATHH